MASYRLGQITDRRQIGDRAVHRKHAVGGDQAIAGVPRLAQPRLQVRHVVVGVAEPLRLAQAHAVDDGGVVQRIRDDRVLGAQEALEQTRVGVETTGEEDRVFHAQEIAQPLFQTLVGKLGAADEPDRRHAESVFAQRLPGGLDQPGVVGQTQIVVGAQIDAGRTTLKSDLPLLRRGDDLLLLEQALGLEGFDPCGEIADEGVCHVPVARSHPEERPGRCVTVRSARPLPRRTTARSLRLRSRACAPRSRGS